jgi:hypothetical protein
MSQSASASLPPALRNFCGSTASPSMRLSDVRPNWSCARSENSPAKSDGGLVNNNEIYKLWSFRVRRQRPEPRPAENNNEYQAENKGRGHGQEHLCLSQILSALQPRRKQGPARSPARVHFVSFNFTNTTIRRMSSTPATDLGCRADAARRHLLGRAIHLSRASNQYLEDGLQDHLFVPAPRVLGAPARSKLFELSYHQISLLLQTARGLSPSLKYPNREGTSVARRAEHSPMR